MKTYHFMVYVKPDKPIKFAPVQASNLDGAWNAFMKANSQAIAIIEGGGSSKRAVINFAGLTGRIWARQTVIHQITGDK